VLAAAVAAAAAPVGAQPRSPAGCADGALGAPAGDGVDTVHLAVGRAVGAVPPAGVARSVLDAVAEEFRMPAAAAGAVSMGGRRLDAPGAPLVVHPALGATFLVELRRDGRVARIRVTQRSLVDGVDAALYRAVQTADSARAFFARTDGPATLPLSVRLTLRPEAGEASRPVALLRQPRYGPAENARLLSALPLPSTPEARDGVSAEEGVRVAFEAVVDVSGRVVAGTERLVEYTNPAFAVQVFEWLRHEARFAPARVGGCPVRQLVWWGLAVGARPQPPSPR
jgi:hypothetical protein